jgi:hypothetical protein
MRDLRQAMRDSRDELHDAMEDNANLETIRRLADEQGKQTANMIVLRAEIRNKINAVLSEEQQKQLTELRDQRKDAGRPRHEMDQRPGGDDSRQNQRCAKAASQDQSCGQAKQGRGSDKPCSGMDF